MIVLGEGGADKDIRRSLEFSGALLYATGHISTPSDSYSRRGLDLRSIGIELSIVEGYVRNITGVVPAVR